MAAGDGPVRRGGRRIDSQRIDDVRLPVLDRSHRHGLKGRGIHRDPFNLHLGYDVDEIGRKRLGVVVAKLSDECRVRGSRGHVVDADRAETDLRERDRVDE